eukprot:jgi/Botrbrau1/8010/Bobra.384_2s0032.1
MFLQVVGLTSPKKLLSWRASSGRTTGSRSHLKCFSMYWARDPNNRNPRPENVEGSFYVDHTCIDCDTCRWMAPDVFGRVGDQSAVVAQPSTSEGRVQALQALLSCPTFSIPCQREAGWGVTKGYSRNAYPC